MDLDEALAFHAKFRIRLRAFVQSPEASVPDSIRRDDLCALGQWLYGPGKQQYAKYAAFGNLLQCHKSLHDAAAQVAEKAIAGHKEAALHMFEPEGDFALRSKLIVQAIAELKKAIE